MVSFRQKLSKIRRQSSLTVVIESSFKIQNLRLGDRNVDTGNWSATSANGAALQVTKRGVNSGQGLELPGITVKQGLGRFAN